MCNVVASGKIMRDIKRIIFVVGNGVSRAPMATGVFQQLCTRDDIEVLCRGLVVQFPEPLNQKAEAVMISNGINMPEFSSQGISDEDYIEGTIAFTMDSAQRARIIDKIPSANEENTFVLSEFVGDELEIMDPYGGTLQTYGICFELIKNAVKKMIEKLELQ